MFELAVATLPKRGQAFRAGARAAGGTAFGMRQICEQIADQRAIQNSVIGLVPIVQEAFVARPAAPVRGPILQGVGIVVTDRKRPARERGQRRRTLGKLAQNAGASFRRLVEEYLPPFVRRGHRLAGELARFKLEVLLDGLLEGRLETRHLGSGRRRVEAHDQSVLGVLDERHHPRGPPFGGRIVLVLSVGLVARPVAALQVEIEAARLVSILVRPAEADAVEIGGVAVAEPERAYIVAVNLRILAVEPAVDLGEAVCRDQVVAEALPLLLVAGDALSEAQAHVLQLDEAVDAGRRIKGGAATIADLGKVGVARLKVGIAAARATLHRVGDEPTGVLGGVRAEVEVDFVYSGSARPRDRSARGGRTPKWRGSGGGR